MKKLFSLAALTLLFCGCSAMRPVSPAIREFDFPVIGETHEENLGETLIEQGVIKSFPAIELGSAARGSFGLGGNMRVEGGKLVAAYQDDYGTYYRSATGVAVSSPFQSGVYEGGIFISFQPKWGASIYAQLGGARPAKSAKLQEFNYRESIADNYLPGSFRQELIYNGKSGNTLKFLYRELNDSYLRAPFSQEVTYDLNESRAVGFKNARIEVIDATNEKIKYKVLKTFSR